MSCCFIIGTEKDYKERLDEIGPRLQRTFRHVYHIPYDCGGCDVCKTECNYKVDYSIDILSNSSDMVAFYMDGWKKDPLCKFLDQYVKLTDMEFILELDMDFRQFATYTTEDGYVVCRDEDWTEDQVRSMIHQINVWDDPMDTLARKYDTDIAYIWRVLDRNRDKLERVPW